MIVKVISMQSPTHLLFSIFPPPLNLPSSGSRRHGLPGLGGLDCGPVAQDVQLSAISRHGCSCLIYDIRQSQSLLPSTPHPSAIRAQLLLVRPRGLRLTSNGAKDGVKALEVATSLARGSSLSVDFRRQCPRQRTLFPEMCVMSYTTPTISGHSVRFHISLIASFFFGVSIEACSQSQCASTIGLF